MEVLPIVQMAEFVLKKLNVECFLPYPYIKHWRKISLEWQESVLYIKLIRQAGGFHKICWCSAFRESVLYVISVRHCPTKIFAVRRLFLSSIWKEEKQENFIVFSGKKRKIQRQGSGVCFSEFKLCYFCLTLTGRDPLALFKNHMFQKYRGFCHKVFLTRTHREVLCYLEKSFDFDRILWFFNNLKNDKNAPMLKLEPST